MVRPRMLVLGIVLLGAVLVLPARAQSREHTMTREPGVPGPAATVQDLAWIAGHWQGEALGGLAEEVWAPPLGGTMMGMFKLVTDEGIRFYEFITLEEEEGSLVMKIKHFNDALTGWEERDETVDFPLVKLTPTEAYFDGLTIRRIDDDTIQFWVAIGSDDGTVREEEFLYQRVDP